jgi:hypothetical protein
MIVNMLHAYGIDTQNTPPNPPSPGHTERDYPTSNAKRKIAMGREPKRSPAVECFDFSAWYAIVKTTPLRPKRRNR